MSIHSRPVGLANIIGLSAMLSVTLAACAAGPAPRNLPDARWMPQHLDADGYEQTCGQLTETAPAAFTNGQQVPIESLSEVPTLLAPGDRLRISVVGDAGGLSGVYVIGKGGMLEMPGMAPLPTQRLDVEALESRLRDALLAARLVRPLERVVEVQLIESAGVSVSVNGAVFQEGTVRVGERSSENRIGQREGAADGDDNPSRTVSAALRAAGGVRPDADIEHVLFARGNQWSRIDLADALYGTGLADLQLTAGDRVFVGSTGCFNADLVKPSALTAPGIRVFMSNLSRPASSNASSAIGKEATSLPYGTRFLQGLVSANCVGGSAMNSGRHAVLISRNPINGQSIVIEREVEELVRGARRDAFDPYLMPGDAIACYDSGTMNFRDAINVLGEAFGSVVPAILLGDQL